MWGRRRRDRSPLPPNWRELTATALAHWAVLDDDERDHLGDLMADIASRRWEAANGFALTDEIRVVIAAQAALLILGLDVDCYRDVSAIVVHPTTVTLHGERAGPAPGLRTDGPVTIVGQAHDRRGPVLIAWDAAQRRRPPSGAGPQRRAPRVRPQARHARRHGRRHAPAAGRGRPATLGRGVHGRVPPAPVG